MYFFRFRANLIVEGGEAFGEESWSGFQIGGAEFKVGGPCRRYLINTIHTYIKGLVAMFMNADLLLYLYMISILKSNCQVSNDYRGTGNRGGEGPI